MSETDRERLQFWITAWSQLLMKSCNESRATRKIAYRVFCAVSRMQSEVLKSHNRRTANHNALHEKRALN